MPTQPAAATSPREKAKLDLQIPIPSWVVGTAGAVIVILSTAITTISLAEIRSKLGATRSEVATVQDQIQSAWNNHLLSERRSTSADALLAMALRDEAGSADILFALRRVADHLQGAVLAMWVASGDSLPDESPQGIRESTAKLAAGDLSGYAVLRSSIDSLQLQVQQRINTELAERLSEKNELLSKLEARESQHYLWYVSMNLLGLIVTMCKDLPMWKRSPVQVA